MNMKTISILLALVNSLAAGLVLASTLPGTQLIRLAASVWQVAKVMASVAIIAAGIVTWVAASRATNQDLVLTVGLFLVALGTASAVWTVHLALNGIIKDHMFLYGGSLMAQGASSIWTLLSAGRNTAIT
jgi:hypothetical protein